MIVLREDLDLSKLSDRQLKAVSNLMKINAQQIIDFNEAMAREQARRRNGPS